MVAERTPISSQERKPKKDIQHIHIDLMHAHLLLAYLAAMAAAGFGGAGEIQRVKNMESGSIQVQRSFGPISPDIFDTGLAVTAIFIAGAATGQYFSGKKD